MMISSPDDSTCTYSGCYISSDTGPNYMSVDNTIVACKQPFPTPSISVC